MSEIKTAEERIHPMALDDKSVWCNAYFDEVAELRAAYEALSGKCHELKARSEIDARTVEALQKENERLDFKWKHYWGRIRKVLQKHRERDAAQAKRIAHLEYKIDELMLEWCPDEMTPEQLENYAKHQRKASL